MTGNPVDGLYWDFHWPLSLKQLVDDLLDHQRSSPNTPADPSAPALREWFSQPRASTDATTEVVTINLKLPLSLSEVSLEAKRVPVRIEVWYCDRLNNWRQALDGNRIPISLTLSGSVSENNWYKYHTDVYPVVAKAVQLRCTRVPDSVAGDSLYSIGLRNTLLRRNVYDRNAGRLPFEDELDPIGNVVARYIKDWDAPRAIDDKPLTYWRSAPQPDPQAVVNLYLNTCAPDGSPQPIDTLVIDPVYTGQTINLYYSNDETVGTRKLSPITLPPDTDTNTDWRSGRGRWDTSSGPSGTSSYLFPMAIGPLVKEDVWVGIEWYPDFDPENGPALNPVLLGVTPSDPDETQWWPTIFYDAGAGEMVLELTEGTSTKTYSVPLSPMLVPGEPLRIVVGWRYDPDTVFISVRTRLGAELARLENTSPGLPSLMTIDGLVGFQNFRGMFTNHVIKLEDYSLEADVFLTNPGAYVSPDTLLADENGELPSTTLDNAVYAADWTLQVHGSGGTHDSFYDKKTWTPIWRDYLTQKGKLRFPQSIPMRYLKCEFTNLTEEPYPVYDAGVKTSYQVFPIEVKQLVQVKHLGLLGTLLGTLQLGSEIIAGGFGFGHVNWLNPASVRAAVDRIFGPTPLGPVMVTTGASVILSELPTTENSAALNSDTSRTESANPVVYKRDPVSAQTLAGNQINTLTNVTAQNNAYIQQAIAAQLADAFVPWQKFVENPLGPPVQGQDWWTFPGNLLAIPAVIINGLVAATQVVFGRAPTTEWRYRFMTTSVHRYDVKTVTRDAALAYFAGVREVRALSTSYIDEQDPASFEFGLYNSDQWVFNNIAQLDSGPITTAGKVYSIENPGFDLSLAHWEFDPAEGWTRDPAKGRWHWGSLTVEADGTEKNARSTVIDVTPGDTIVFSCWVWWEDLAGTDGEAAIVLGGTTMHAGNPIADIVFAAIDPADWDYDYSYDPDEVVAEGDTPTPNWVRLKGTWTVPAGVDQVRIRPSVTEDATAGRAWFDTINPISGDDMLATAYKEFVTTSTFAKVRCDFRDSGMVRSDAMWARADPLATNIDNLQLAYYVTTIPDVMPGGTWADAFSTWGDKTITWGAARALVAISVDPNRIFDGRRVLKFSRSAGAGSAGLKMVQQTNFVPGALARLCTVFYKPQANNNTITLRLRRVSDGVYIHEETITKPAVGYWYTHEGQFFEIPEGEDQVYTLEVTTTGDDADELGISDAYTEIALIRYFMRLGSSASFLHDVTPLRYAESAQVVTTTPVNEASVQIAIMSPKAFAYGADIMPTYLR